jgi:hypothetical protein
MGRMDPKMTPKKPTKQSSITSMGFPLLQKTSEMCVVRQIQVLGSYWTGCMSNEEVNSLYKCTVREYHALHKWDVTAVVAQLRLWIDILDFSVSPYSEKTRDNVKSLSLGFFKSSIKIKSSTAWTETDEFDTVTVTVEFDTVTDEIGRWSSLSEDEFQRFVEDGVLNEFEMM